MFHGNGVRETEVGLVQLCKTFKKSRNRWSWER